MQLTAKGWRKRLEGGELGDALKLLYCEEALAGERGLYDTLCGFSSRFGEETSCGLFSASGRTELSGNHTDHQRGCVLCAAVTLDMTAAAAPREDMTVRILSEGFGEISADLSDLGVVEREKGSSAALIRGIAKAISDKGGKLRGFDAYIRSNVPQGSGLSSSAAYEVLIGKIFSELFCEDVFSPTELAIFGQYAENVYFGKPCGLMDQMASALGGVVFIDFENPKEPKARGIEFDFEGAGYSLCITNAGGSHADLTGDYAAITEEMRSVSRFFGKNALREVCEQEFRAAIPSLRGTVCDRAILRAMHFFDENRRVHEQLRALEDGETGRYLELMNASGRSSMTMLQNIWPTFDGGERSLALALALSEAFLKGDGAVRVHGGGFAGTIQAFVPTGRTAEYKKLMDETFGEGACCVMAVRPVGAYCIK